jgi:hypothetical protein
MRRAPMTDKDVVAGDSCGRRTRKTCTGRLGLCSAARGLDVMRWLAAKFGVLKLDRKTNDVMAGRSRSCRPESGSSVQCPARPKLRGMAVSCLQKRLSATENRFEGGKILEWESLTRLYDRGRCLFGLDSLFVRPLVFRFLCLSISFAGYLTGFEHR